MQVRKRAYRAQNIKKLDAEKLIEAVRGERVVVATDVAKVDMVSSIELWSGELVALVKWKNPCDLRVFVGLATALAEASTELECVQEPTGSYGDPLRVMLEGAGLAVYRVSPKHVHDLREAYDGTPSSHDPKAARIIADTHRRGWSSLWTEHGVEQHALLRGYEVFIDEKQRLVGRLEGRLARHWPEVMHLLKLDSTTLLELLVKHKGPGGVSCDVPSARALMRSTGRGLLRTEKLEAVLRSAWETVGVPTTQAESQELALLARELLRVKAEIRQQKQALAVEANKTPVVRSIAQVVGKSTAVVLLTLLGDPADYPSAGAYLKAAGLNLREHSSGKKHGQLAITKRGPGLVRQLLYFAVLRLVQRDCYFKAWHERKKARSGRKEGKKSIIALARKLLSGLWHVGRGSAWDPSRLFSLVPSPVVH